MNKFYDWQIPGTWVDIYDEIFIPAMIAAWSPRLAELVGLRAGERMLDVACGTGMAWSIRSRQSWRPRANSFGSYLG